MKTKSCKAHFEPCQHALVSFLSRGDHSKILTGAANQKSKIEDRERRRDERREGYKAQIRQHEELFIERAQATLDFTV